MKTFILCMMVAKLGFAAHEAVSGLKMLEKGMFYSRFSGVYQFLVLTYFPYHYLLNIVLDTSTFVDPCKLLTPGLKKEDLALTALIDFPFQIFFGYFAAKWSTGLRALSPVCIWLDIKLMVPFN